MKSITIIITLFLCISLAASAQDSINTKQQKNTPKATYRIGSAKITVWENTYHGKNGDFTKKNFQVEKIYKKGNDWKSTNNFSEKELIQLRQALQEAVTGEKIFVIDEVKTIKTKDEKKERNSK